MLLLLPLGEGSIYRVYKVSKVYKEIVRGPVFLSLCFKAKAGD